jgi:hypothetical protein
VPCLIDIRDSAPPLAAIESLLQLCAEKDASKNRGSRQTVETVVPVERIELRTFGAAVIFSSASHILCRIILAYGMNRAPMPESRELFTMPWNVIAAEHVSFG